MIRFESQCKVDSFANSFEQTVTKISFLPVLLPGLAKALFGMVQLMGGGLIALSASAQACVTGEEDSNHTADWGKDHCLHGLGNIAAGTIEAIPLIAIIALLARNFFFSSSYMNRSSSGFYFELDDSYDCKLFQYRNICQGSVIFRDCLNGETSSVNLTSQEAGEGFRQISDKIRVKMSKGYELYPWQVVRNMNDSVQNRKDSFELNKTVNIFLRRATKPLIAKNGDSVYEEFLPFNRATSPIILTDKKHCQKVEFDAYKQALIRISEKLSSLPNNESKRDELYDSYNALAQHATMAGSPYNFIPENWQKHSAELEQSITSLISS